MRMVHSGIMRAIAAACPRLAIRAAEPLEGVLAGMRITAFLQAAPPRPS
jgi:Na+/phosphate symporter